MDHKQSVNWRGVFVKQVANVVIKAGNKGTFVLMQYIQWNVSLLPSGPKVELNASLVNSFAKVAISYCFLTKSD